MKKLKALLVLLLVLTVAAALAGGFLLYMAKAQPLSLTYGETAVTSDTSLLVDGEDVVISSNRDDMTIEVVTAYDVTILVDGTSVLIPAGADMSAFADVTSEGAEISIGAMQFGTVFSKMYPDSEVFFDRAMNNLDKDLFRVTVEVPVADSVTFTFMYALSDVYGVSLSKGVIVF